jgi:hypothetical protein
MMLIYKNILWSEVGKMLLPNHAYECWQIN